MCWFPKEGRGTSTLGLVYKDCKEIMMGCPGYRFYRGLISWFSGIGPFLGVGLYNQG